MRYAVRILRRGRLFTVVAVVCLALGIATNTTMFSVFDAMFLRPLPFKDPDRLVSIAGRHPQTGRRVALSLDDMGELAPALQSFEGLAAYSGRTATLTDGGEPERVSFQIVTAHLLPTLGEQPRRVRDRSGQFRGRLGPSRLRRAGGDVDPGLARVGGESG